MFTLEGVVPWGRSFDEYRRMFALTNADLSRRILGCADGPASFNAEATRRGARVVSCDPLYRFRVDEIEHRILETREQVIEQTRLNVDRFVWTGDIDSIGKLREVRMTAMDTFLDDFDAGRASGRYVDGALPALPFNDWEFDVALCSHFLFLYGTSLGEAFHVASVLELARVSKEVRVFPLLDLDGARSTHLEACMTAVRDAGMSATIEPVPYEFQRGGNEMMRITSR